MLKWFHDLRLVHKLMLISLAFMIPDSVKRVYKNAFSHDSARAIILGDAGTHFDPVIVQAYVATEAAFVEVGERFRDRPQPMAA